MEVIGGIILLMIGLWFIGVVIKWKKALKTNNPDELLNEAIDLFEYSGYGDPVGKKCLLKAMKYASNAKNPYVLYQELAQEFFMMQEEDLMHICYKKAKKYYVPYSEEELYSENGKLKRRKKKSY